MQQARDVGRPNPEAEFVEVGKPESWVDSALFCKTYDSLWKSRESQKKLSHL